MSLLFCDHKVDNRKRAQNVSLLLCAYKVDNKKRPLNFVTQELVNSGKQLEEITDMKMNCLEVFLKHRIVCRLAQENSHRSASYIIYSHVAEK